MKYIKYIFLIPSLFAVLACGSEESYSADGDSAWACYSPQSAIYNADINSDSEGASRSTAAAKHTATFKDNDSVIYEVNNIQEGSVITLPDIRAKHCFHGRENQILAGWNDKSDNYTTGGFYTVTKDVTFSSVWEDGVEIYNAAELDNISDNLSGKYKLMRNIDLKDYTDGAGWTPIGDEDNLFTGRLYGNGYRIDNLTIDNKTGSVAGLFGAIGGNAEIYDLSINLAKGGISLTKDGTNKAAGALAGYIKYENDSNIIIKNVRTAGGEIKADNCSTSVDRHLYAGGLVGGAVASPSFTGGAKIVLDNLSNSIPVSAAVSVNSCFAYLGGIIGGTDTGAETTLTFAENSGNVNADTYSNAFSGGIVGCMEGSGTIENDNNTGNVSAKSSGGGYAYAGGIAGTMVDGTIENNNNVGRIEAKSDGNYIAYSGGIVGQVILNGVSLTIKDNSNNGAVSTESGTAYSGGIAGSMEVIGLGIDAEAKIENNSNTGKVETDASSGDAYAGGIAGDVTLRGGTSSMVNKAATVIIDNCSNSGSDNISANSTYFSYSGGIVGRIEGNGTKENSQIKNSRNTDNVTSTTSAPASLSFYSSYSGGIVGDMGGGTIETSYNKGVVKATASNSIAQSGGIAGRVKIVSVENTYNHGAVSAEAYGNTYSGGIVGYLQGTSTARSSVKTSYNAGNVSADSDAATAYAGGIAGGSEYADINKSAAINYKVDAISSTFSKRICAFTANVTFANNFAYKDMLLNDALGSDDNAHNGTDKEMGMSTGQLNNQNTYTGAPLSWDFTIWTWDDTNNLPILRWQKEQ